LSVSRLSGTSLTRAGLQSTMLSTLLHDTPETMRGGLRVQEVRGRTANRFAAQCTTPEGETGNEGVVASRLHGTSIPTGALQDHDIPVRQRHAMRGPNRLGMASTAVLTHK